MKDIIYTVLAIAAIFIGLPVLLLWVRDRGGVVGTLIMRILGGISLAFGLIIIGWVVFNLVHPTKEYVASRRTPFQLLIPAGMVWMGWRWLRDEGPGIEETAVDFECEGLRRSVERARETLPWFLEQVKQNVDGAYIKFPLKTPNGLTEHIWAYVHSHHDDLFNVSLSNEPLDKDQTTSGRRDVALAEVEDW